MSSLWAELRRRNVTSVGIAYAVAGWLVIEVASVVLPAFNAAEWILQALIIVVVIGFPLTLLLAWAFELTPEGLKRDADVDPARSFGPRMRRRLNAITIATLLVAVAFFAFERFISTDEAAGGANRKSIAVLPFENMSRDPANEPFTVGIHDDLLTHISRISSVKTISRTSVLQYRNTSKTTPQIAKELGVATVLEGGVQRAGDRVRINVQLIDAAADEHLWAHTYDRQLTATNVFAIQSEIATAIADALRATLTSDEQRRIDFAPTKSLAAMESYFLGKQLLEERTRESLFAAVEYFEKVIELDPQYALAHSGLADAYMLLPEYTPSVDMGEARERSERAASRALELDPDQPEVLASMGWNRLIHYYEWKEAEVLLRRALGIEPNNAGALHWLSHVLSWQGRQEGALRAAERAVEVDPLSTLMAINLNYIRTDARLFDDSIAGTYAVLSRDPDYPEIRGNLWLTYLRAGRPDDAATTIQQWAAATGRDVQAAREVGDAFVRHKQTGERQFLPEELLARVQLGLEDLAQVYAFFGDAEGAMDALERGFEERSGSRSVLSMKVNPGYDFIRDDPRFIALMKRVGFQDGDRIQL